MKLKKISILFILLPLCIFFTACSKENDNAPKQSENIIDFEQGNMNFTEGAGEQTFSFTTNTAWVVSVASTRNRGVPWCTVAPTSGNAGSHTIKVTTTPNETYDDRSVTVTLKAGAEVKSFVVSQKQKDALLLTNDKFEVDQAGGTVTVEVKSNVSYTATIGEECKDWIKESNSTRALSTTTKSYTVAMNEDGKKREGSIIFSDGSLTETVHIYQAGGSIILLSQNDCHVSASGEEITVELRSNCDYEVVMPSVDWIKETMTRGMSSHTLHYTVAPNDSYDGRKTEIIYRDKSDSSIADTLTILQAQKDAIIISEKEVKVGSEGGTVEVKIDANVDFEMQLPDVEWISETSTRGLSTHKKYLKIAENTGETSRTAEVVFKNTTSGIEETLTVSQSAKGKRVKVHVEKAGTLSDYIAESEKLNVEELEVSGNLGGKDIAFIREMAGTYNHANTEGKLVYLDMTEANIVADGEYYLPKSATVPKNLLFFHIFVALIKNAAMKYTTIIDIAQALGISKSTVSRALRGDKQNVSKETRERILAMAKKMGYTRNELAVNLRKQSTRTIGIVVPEMLTPFYMNFITYAQQELNRQGYRVTLAQSHENPNAELANLQMFEDYRVEGILISVCHTEKNLATYQRIMKKGIPMVFFDRTLSSLPISKVKIDDYLKSFFLVEQMIRRGKRRIVHLAGPDYIQNSQERKRGYRDALEKFHLPYCPEYVIDAGVDFSGGEQAVEQLLKQHIAFDALFCFTEMSALGAKSNLQKHGVQIPDEVAIACISGTDLCVLVHPSITAVEQPVKQMAEEASRLIVQKVEHPELPDKTIILEAETIYREST